MAERVTSGGIPRPAAADELEEDEGEELDTDDDDDQPSLSASYLAPPLNDSGARLLSICWILVRWFLQHKPSIAYVLGSSSHTI